MSGSCHCGAVRIEAAGAPEWVASCNCSLCRRTGALMAYYRPEDVRVEGETATYVTGDRFIRLHHCKHCGCHTHWSANPDALAGELPEEVRAALAERMGVNARLADLDPAKELRDLKMLMILQLLNSGVRQRQIAAALGVSEATVSRLLPKGLSGAKAKETKVVDE